VVQSVVDRVPGAGILDVETQSMYGQDYEDIQRRVPDCTAALETFGWQATTNLDQGVEQSLAWAEDNPWWADLPLVTTGKA